MTWKSHKVHLSKRKKKFTQKDFMEHRNTKKMVMKHLFIVYLIYHLIIYSFIFLHLFSLYNRRRQWHPTPVLLPGESHGWRSLVGCSPWGC